MNGTRGIIYYKLALEAHLRVVRAAALPPQVGFHPRAQFVYRKRLGNIIVPAGYKTGYFIVILYFCRKITQV